MTTGRREAVFNAWTLAARRYLAVIAALERGETWVAVRPDEALNALNAAHRTFHDAYGISNGADFPAGP